MAEKTPDLIGKLILRSDNDKLKELKITLNEPFYSVLHRLLVKEGYVKEEIKTK